MNAETPAFTADDRSPAAGFAARTSGAALATRDALRAASEPAAIVSAWERLAEIGVTALGGEPASGGWTEARSPPVNSGVPPAPQP